ncbi:MAG: conjugal transfer protein TraD [Sphingomonadales bacterium]|nr:conjugal transfer protein TraD [Sphingomonadales bacterium]
MRKPRDIDSELKALAERAKQLKERRVQQLGELVIATGADGMDAETLAGALLSIVETSDAARKELAQTRRGLLSGAARKRGEELNTNRTALAPDGGAAPAKHEGADRHARMAGQTARTHATTDRAGRTGRESPTGRTHRR